MLVVSRRVKEGVYVGRDVHVTVAATGPSLVVQLERKVPLAITRCNNRRESRWPVHLAEQGRMDSMPDIENDTRPVQLVFHPRDAVWIGRNIELVVLGPDPEREPAWRFGIDAPAHVAISRDDFSWTQHVEFCRRKERGAA